MIKITKLDTLEEIYFDESNSREDALINAYLLESGFASRLHDKKMREDLREKIVYCGPNNRTMSLGDFATPNK